MQLTKFVRNIEISVHPIITNHSQYVSLCMILSLGLGMIEQMNTASEA